MRNNTLSMLVAMLFIGMALQAQTRTIQFNYDAAGNRTDRVIVLSKKQLKSVHTDSTLRESGQEKEEFKDKLSDMDIRIYPNPTHGELKVTIENFVYDMQGRVEVYNYLGTLILTQKLEQDNLIDLLKQPSGMYILRLYIGNDRSEWKIIKK